MLYSLESYLILLIDDIRVNIPKISLLISSGNEYKITFDKLI